MDWTSLLAGILVGGVIAGSMAFLLGVAVGSLVGQREARGCMFMDQLDEDTVDTMEGLDLMLDESKRLN